MARLLELCKVTAGPRSAVMCAIRRIGLASWILGGFAFFDTCQWSSAIEVVVTVTSQPTPNPAAKNDAVTAMLSAMDKDPPVGYGAPTWVWKLTVEYRDSQMAPWSPATTGYSVSVGPGNSNSPTLLATFAVAGYWKITAEATAFYGPQYGSGQVSLNEITVVACLLIQVLFTSWSQTLLP